jgi:hypothetical protein
MVAVDEPLAAFSIGAAGNTAESAVAAAYKPLR